jgi:hypothetical protein
VARENVSQIATASEMAPGGRIQPAADTVPGKRVAEQGPSRRWVARVRWRRRRPDTSMRAKRRWLECARLSPPSGLTKSNSPVERGLLEFSPKTRSSAQSTNRGLCK